MCKGKSSKSKWKEEDCKQTVLNVFPRSAFTVPHTCSDNLPRTWQTRFLSDGEAGRTGRGPQLATEKHLLNESDGYGPQRAGGAPVTEAGRSLAQYRMAGGYSSTAGGLWVGGGRGVAGMDFWGPKSTRGIAFHITAPWLHGAKSEQALDLAATPIQLPSNVSCQIG